MIDVVKFFCMLDLLDPRLNPIVLEGPGVISMREALLRNMLRAEVLLSVLDKDPDNLLRKKGKDVVAAIQTERDKCPSSELDDA